MSGYAIWDISRQACYQYVQHIKADRCFRDTLVLDTHIYNNPDKVVWIKKNEIRYNDRMFDIKHISVQNNTTILIGHYDDFEHEIYKVLQKLFDNEKDNPQHQMLTAWTSLVATIPKQVVYKPNFLTASHIHTYYWHNRFLTLWCTKPLLAPPDQITFIS